MVEVGKKDEIEGREKEMENMMKNGEEIEIKGRDNMIEVGEKV